MTTTSNLPMIPPHYIVVPPSCQRVTMATYLTGRVMSRPSSAPARSSQLADLILAHVLNHGLEPGDVLPAEGKLAAHFQVSRPVIREAIKQLEGRGILEVINGRGAVVRPLSEVQLVAYFTHAIAVHHLTFRELMEARRPIEVQSARLAAQRRTPEQLEAMQAIVQRMRRNIGNADVYVDLDRDLHALIAEASGNVIIMHLVRAFRGALNDLTHEMLYRRRNRQQLERVHILHDAIVTEIGYRNAEAAGRAMDVHFGEALAFLIERQEGMRR
jgi:GntR family transcriptional repressor for pyruvate dehydrogenase complex